MMVVTWSSRVHPQVTDNAFLEDINGMLTAGEVANLYAPDELVAVRDAVRADVKAAGLPELNDTMWAVFIERVRAHLHICLCMSPVGNTFRDYVRMFPALVSCTTIDWFSDWPADALKEVAPRPRPIPIHRRISIPHTRSTLLGGVALPRGCLHRAGPPARRALSLLRRADLGNYLHQS